MRKILSLLGAMFLSTTASTSVIACGGGTHTTIKGKIDLNTNDLKKALHFTKNMYDQNAFDELRLKIKNLSNGVYKDTYEIRNDNTILISIWLTPTYNINDDAYHLSLFTVDKVDVKIKVTENNKAFKKMNWITLSQIPIFDS